MNQHVREWPIRDVALATGLTSRALRHYERVGLLLPSRVADNGYRFYGDAELSRLYRILSLRALELPLAAIRRALDDEQSLTEAIREHLGLLEERRDRTIQQITVVENTLRSLAEGTTMSINEVFAGFDNTEYEAEVRERWGDDAWERSSARRERLDDAGRAADDRRSADVNAALRDAATAGIDPLSAPFQALIADHYDWVTDQWGGKKPEHNAYLGLAQLYVEDDRFAKTYGGHANAETIRVAIHSWAADNLA